MRLQGVKTAVVDRPCIDFSVMNDRLFTDSIIVEYLLCEFSLFNIFNELLSAKIEKIELTDKRVNPCCEMCWNLPSTTQW